MRFPIRVVAAGRARQTWKPALSGELSLCKSRKKTEVRAAFCGPKICWQKVPLHVSNRLLLAPRSDGLNFNLSAEG